MVAEQEAADAADELSAALDSARGRVAELEAKVAAADHEKAAIAKAKAAEHEKRLLKQTEKATKEHLSSIKRLAYEEDADLFVPVTSPLHSVYEARASTVLPASCRAL